MKRAPVALFALFISLSTLAQPENDNAKAIASIQASSLSDSLKLPEPLTPPEYITIQLEKGDIFTFPAGPQTPEQVHAYAELDEEQKARFQEKRAMLLQGVARILGLGAAKLPLGTITVVGDHIVLAARPVKRGLNSTIIYPVQNLVARLMKKETPSHPEAVTPEAHTRDIKERGRQVNEAILHGLDAFFFENPLLVSKANEGGGILNLSPMIMGGIAKTGAGGSAGLGLKFGYNLQQKAVVIELVDEIEKFVYAFTPTLQISLAPKIGFYVSASDEKKPFQGHRSGIGLYPPAAPGYFTSATNYAAVGINTNIIGLAGPVGDWFAYKTALDQHVLLKLSVSPAVPGWVQANSILADVTKQAAGSVAQVARRFAKNYIDWQHQVCANTVAALTWPFRKRDP
jgi:hypothetical protein